MKRTKLLALLLLPLLFVACKQNEPEEIQPTALFSYAQNDLTITFTNASQNAQSYSWDFGDGKTSSEENPVHTYSKAGTWQVKLTAKNIAKTDTYLQNITISQADVTPTAKFSYTKNGLAVTFTNTSTNAQSYNWEFGDGQSSTANSPLHTYSSAGTYKVTLTAKNGSKTNSTSQNITLTEQAPKASFTYKTEHPLKAVFTNNSTNATSYEWDFGDGTKSTEKSPTHRFNTLGVYKVKLTAKSGNKSDTYQMNVTVEAPTTCYISGVTFNKIPNNNYYYQIQITDDYVLSKTTYLWTVWFLLSSANLPYDRTFNTPKQISISNKYVLRLYKSSSKQSDNTQASGKGDWTATITAAKLQTYPESLTYSDTSASITLKFQWK